MIAGIVLGAGRSSRLGRTKALLPAGEGAPTFLEAVVAALRDGGVDAIYVVLGGNAGEIEARVALPPGGTYVRNPGWESGQLSSLLAALTAADRPGVEAALVTLIDMPLVTAATVRTLADAFDRHPDAPIVRATFQGRHGHPVLFARAVFDALRRADPAAGARSVVRAHEVLDVEVNDPGVITDIDTWDDYERVFGRAHLREV
jgi:CTP:molybdopterin cytidylyltransferase MocA